MTPEERAKRKQEIKEHWEKALSAPVKDKQVKRPTRKK